MYPDYVPDLVADQFNQTSLDNISDTLKKVWPALAGSKKRGFKLGSNVKARNTHKDWYLACEA